MFLRCLRLPALWLAIAMPVQAADSDWLAAREAFRKGDDAALQAASVAMGDSPLAVYGEYWQLLRRLKTAPVDEITRFLRREKGGYLAEKLRAEWLRQLARNGDWSRFRSEFSQLVDASDNEFLCLRLQADLADGISSDERERARQVVWLTAKDQPAACTPVIEALQREGVISSEDRWLRLRLALEANAWPLARFVLRSQGTEISVDALKAMADKPADFVQGADLARRDQRELAAWALGRWARQDFFTARQWLEARSDAFVEELPQAWRQLALAASRRFDPEAEAMFARSESAWWPDLHRETRLRQLVRQGRWQTYADLYDSLPDTLRESRAWRYWNARALQALDLRFASRRAFSRLSGEDDYYGLLALEALGKVMTSDVSAVELDDDDRAALAGHAGFLRALALQGLGQRFDAVSEWNWAVRGADDRLLLAAAERATAIGWHDRAIYAAERTKRLHDVRFRYLSPWREVTRGYARELGLDEAWVYGLIRQESRFVNTARSSVGAGGLMQLMPGTAQWVANRLGIAYHADIVNEVGQNVRLGTYYLSHIERELGHPVLATAGYNAGPRRAREWQGDVDLDATRYIESIPFGETRDYVKKVMTNAVHYARLFGEGETRLLARLGTVPARQMTPVPIEGP